MGVNMRGLIFGKTLESAEYRMEKLIQDYELYWSIVPEKIRKCRNEFSVVFKNGDYWQAVRFSENQRGRRANVLILDRNLNMNEIDLAKRALIEKPYGSVTYYYYEGKK